MHCSNQLSYPGRIINFIFPTPIDNPGSSMERVLTSGPGGRILTHCNVWSHDGEWIVYDSRSDAAGNNFDSTRIERVHTDTGEIRTVYEARNGACCGVATWHPHQMKVVFILGPEHPTPEYRYGPSRRLGAIVDVMTGKVLNLDALDLTRNTPGAHSGGSHVHIWHPHGDWIRFTYDDDVESTGRNIAVAIPGTVAVLRTHPRNRDGNYFSKILTRTDENLQRACEECWVGTSRAIAFQGTVGGVVEVCVVELDSHYQQLTQTSARCHRGIQGPRHWLQSDGERIACLMKDDAGIVQLWTVTLIGQLRQLTRCQQGIQSAFTWHGKRIAAVADGCVSVIDDQSGSVTPLSPASTPDDTIRPEACVFAPGGQRIAYVRRRAGVNHICVTSVE